MAKVAAYTQRRDRFVRAVSIAARECDLPYATAVELVLRTLARITDDVVDGKMVSIPGFGTFGAMAAQVCRGRHFRPVYAVCGFNPSRQFVAATARTLDPYRTLDGVGRLMRSQRKQIGPARKHQRKPLNLDLPYPRDYIEQTVIPRLIAMREVAAESVDESRA